MRALFAALVLLLPAVAPAQEPAALLDPAQARDLLEAPVPESLTAGADQLVLFDRERVIVEDSGLSHRHRHRFVKVLTADGALALRALRFDYDPASNTLELRGIRVHRAGGGVEDVPAATARDVAQPTGLINWGARMQIVGLPPLGVGDGVETLTYSKGYLIAYLGQPEDSPVDPVPAADAMHLLDSTATALGDADDSRYVPPMRGHFYDKVRFAEELPLLEKRYAVSLPADKPLQFSVYNGEVASRLLFEGEGADLRHRYEFWREDVPAVKHEPRMPDLDDVAPKVVMATTASWQEKSRWFWETNEWVFASNAEIDAKVRALTAGLPRDEQIAVLLHWVAQNIRYFGLSMGKGEGYTIHPSAMTFRDRAGVCKDIAGMLVTMLRSAGFEAYGAMTMAGARVEQIPADQFNHCVVALRREDGSFQMLDPTWAPWNNAEWSRWEGEQNYVIGTPEGEGLASTRSFAPEENLLTVESEARLAEDGALVGTLRFEGRGVADGALRGMVANHAQRELRPTLERWLGHLSPRVELTEFLFSDHRDFTRDTTLRLTYRIPGWAADRGDAVELRSPALALLAHGGQTRIGAIPASDTREHPLFLWAGQRVQIDETLELPRGLTWKAPERVALSESQAALACDWTARGRSLALTASCQVNQRTIPAADFPGLRKVADALEQRADEPLVATR
ncbi:MAG: DUF3857 domain-containing transglutaminase family protein [Candidatus Krumholzibacteriia bacterium]|nr:DUF3857 domain-containing transglutaminase family protein [Candidatus Latescibacterota bacterium]